MADIKSTIPVDLELVLGSLNGEKKIEQSTFAALNGIEKAISKAILHADPNVEIDAKIDNKTVQLSVAKLLSTLTSGLDKSKSEVGAEYKKFFDSSLATIQGLQNNFSRQSLKVFRKGAKGGSVSRVSEEILEESHRAAAEIELAYKNLENAVKSAASIYKFTDKDSKNTPPVIYLNRALADIKEGQKAVLTFRKQAEMSSVSKQRREKSYSGGILKKTDFNDLPSSPDDLRILQRVLQREIKSAKDNFRLEPDNGAIDGRISDLQGKLKLTNTALAKVTGNSLAKSYAEAIASSNKYLKEYEQQRKAGDDTKKDPSVRLFALEGAKASISRAIGQARLAGSKGISSDTSKVDELRRELKSVNDAIVAVKAIPIVEDLQKELTAAKGLFTKQKEVYRSSVYGSRGRATALSDLNKFASKISSLESKLGKKSSSPDKAVRVLQTEVMRGDLEQSISALDELTSKLGTTGRRKGDVRKARELANRISSIEKFLGEQSSDPKSYLDNYLQKVADSKSRERLREKKLKPDYYFKQVTDLLGGRSPAQLTEAERKGVTSGYVTAVSKARANMDSLIGKAGFSAAESHLRTVEASQAQWTGALSALKTQSTALASARKKLIDTLKGVAKTRVPSEVLKSLDGFRADWSDIEATLVRISTATSLLRSARTKALGTGQGGLALGIETKLRELSELRKSMEKYQKQSSTDQAKNRHLAIVGRNSKEDAEKLAQLGDYFRSGTSGLEARSVRLASLENFDEFFVRLQRLRNQAATAAQLRRPSSALELKALNREQINPLRKSLADLRKEFKGLVPEEVLDRLFLVHRALDRIQERVKRRLNPAPVITTTDQQARTSLLYGIGKDAYDAAGGSISQIHPTDHKAVSVFLAEERKAIDAKQAAIAQNAALNDREKRRQAREAEGDYDKLVRAQAELNSTMRGNIGLWRQMSVAAKAFFRYAVLYGGAYSLISYFQRLTTTVIDFQDALKGIQVIAKATNEDMGSIGASIRDVSSSTGASLREVASAAETLAQAGVAAKDIPAALKAVSDFALATGSQLQVASDIITSAREIFGEGTTFSGAADQLTKAVNISKLKAEDLRTLFNLGAQTAQASGLTQAQFLGTSATLSNLGIKSSTVATGVRQLLLEIFNPDEKTLGFLRSRYNKLGENLTDTQITALFRSFQTAANPLIAALTELRRLGAGGVAQDEFRRVLDIRAENVALPLLRRLDELAANTAQIGGVGAASEGAADRVDTLRKSLDALAVKAQLAAEAFAGPFMKGLKTMADSTGEFLDAMVKGGERLRRAGRESEVDTETALSGGVLGWALARRFGFGKYGQIATTLAGAAGAEGAVATGQAVDNARSDSKGTVSTAINWLLNTLGLLSIIGTLGKGKAALDAGAVPGITKAVGWVSSFVIGVKSLAAGRELAALAALGRLGSLLSTFAVPTALAALATKVYRDIYDFQTKYLSSNGSSTDAEAFDTLLAEQNRKVEALAEQQKAFDPTVKGSASSEAKDIQDSLNRYRTTLSELFGAEAEKARKVFEELGSVSIEGGTPVAEAAKAKLAEIRGKAFSEADFARLVRAQSDYVSGEQALYGKSRAIVTRAGELMAKSKDQLTATERAFLETYNRLKDSPLFKPGALNPAELGQAVNDLFQLIQAQTISLTEEYRAEAAKRSAVRFASEQPQFEDAYFKFESNTARERLDQKAREIGLSPTAEGVQFLDDYRSFLNNRQQRADVQSNPEWKAAIQRKIKELDDQIRQASDALETGRARGEAQNAADASAAQAREERVARAEEEVRQAEEEQVRLIHERNNSLARQRDLDEKIANAKQQHEWQKLLGPGGLLQEKYQYERKALEADKKLAAAKLRKEAAKLGIDLPSGVGEISSDQAVQLNRSNDTSQAYLQYEEAKRKLDEAANSYRNDVTAITQQSHQKIAFTQTPEYGRRQRRIEEIETELGDSVRESADEVKAKYAELYALEAQNLDDQIAHLKSQKDTYKADEAAKYQADLEELESKKGKLKVSIEKKVGAALREIEVHAAEKEVQSIQQRIKRNEARIQTLSNAQGSVRNFNRNVMGQPPASASGRARLGRVSPNAQWWYNQLLNDPELNLTPEDAAAIVGNLMVESTPEVSPTIVNPNGGAYGSAQWLDSRKTKLFRRPGYDTRETQYDYLKDELLNRNGAENNSSALRGVKAAPGLEAKTVAWRKLFERPGKAEANDEGRLKNAKSVLGIPSSPETSEITRLTQENADLNRQLAEAERRKATAQPGGLTPEAEAAVLEQARTRQYESALQSVQGLLDSQRSANASQQYQVEMANTLGLPEGPAYTATRETAGMSPATADSYGRLVRIGEALSSAKEVADRVLEEALSFRDFTKANLQDLEEQRKTAGERGLTQQQIDDLDAEIKTAADSLKQWESGVREFAQNSNQTTIALAQNRQEMQVYRPTLRGEEYKTKEIGPDGKAVEKLVKVYGQLDQIDFASIEGDLNKLNYAFNKLGTNLRDFAVRVIDTFVTKLAESIINGFNKVDTTALQQAQADLRDAQAEAAYQKAVKTEQIRQINDTLAGGQVEDRAILKRRRDELQAALQESNAAQDAKVRAAQEQARAQRDALASNSGMAGAFQDLAREGATSVLKTAILTPIQSVFKGLFGGGRDGSSEKSALFVQVVNGATGAAGSVVSSATGAVDWLTKSANEIGEIGSKIAGIFGFAEGGMVSGPGTGTSDSIPAWLSNGEYVLTAAEVRAIGAHNLDRWKLAMQAPAKFAQGGMVGAMHGARTAAPIYPSGEGGTSISVIDQRSAATSSPIEVTKTKGPGDKEIIQMLVKDAMKTLHNSGALDRTMAINHGARRPGARR